MPRAGHPVVLALPPGASLAAAFAVPGWRVQRVEEAGPFTLLRAVPDGAEADPSGLGRAAGALLVLSAAPRAACAPFRSGS